jgi:diguanylate cyclase (GGDEF)-like protein
MNGHALIPLIATVSYIPLIVILLANRPWDERRRLFIIFIIPAILWSFSDVLFRSDYFMSQKLLLVRVGLCLGIWMGVQYHYFLRSFYSLERIKIPLVYLLLIAAIVMGALGYMPRGVEEIPGGLNVKYGFAFLSVVSGIFIIGGRDIWYVWRRRRLSENPVERNQLAYLFLGVGVLLLITGTIFFPGGGEYPLAHFGNLLNAAVLTYVVVKHRLIDVRIVLRRFMIGAGVYIVGVACWLLLILLIQYIFNIGINPMRVAIFIGVAIPVIAVFNQYLHPLWRRWVERTLLGEAYNSRGQLIDFISQIYDIPTLEQFGSQLVYLLSESVGTERTCLFLPQNEIEEGDFLARFSYPSEEDNPISQIKLNHSSPVVAWLKRESKVLHRSYIDTIAELQSLWRSEKKEIQLAEVSMFIPLINRGELVAILAVGRKRDGKIYNVEDLDLMESITKRVAASMEKEYLHERLEEQEREQRLINHLIRLITSNMNIQDIFDGFIHEMRGMVDIDEASIALIEDDMVSFLALSVPQDSPWRLDKKIPFRGTAIETVLEKKELYYESDMAAQKNFWPQASHYGQGVQSIVYLPMIAKDKLTGCLIIASRRPNAYNDRQLKLLERLSLQIAMPIENSRLYATAEQRARIDELTGLFNRRHFDEQIKAEISRHSRYSQALSLLMLDLDSFKTYNDIFGHPSGDKLLGEIGRIINSSIRDGDQAFRYGGDEFVVLLPQTREEDAFIVAERIRENVMNRMVAEETTVRFSTGLACYPADGVMADEIVTVADTALYYAKSTGGNRTCLSSSILSGEATISGGNARVSSLSTVYALASAVDAKDHYTYGHSQKVRTYAVILSEAIDLPADAVSRISTAAVLHDIGKIGIPDRILNKEGELDDEDWDAIKAHPEIGTNIAGNVPSLAPCRSGILYHHERWDGKGYPEGLKGDSIPIDARILAIADAFAAMTSSRPYRGTMLDEEAIKELEKEKNKQFDPKLVEIFVNIVKTTMPGKK